MKDREQVTTNGRAAFYAVMWEDLCKAARSEGWALGLHGSLASDMDIMAMEWTEDATPPETMIEALVMCFDKPESIQVSFSDDKPHSRRVYTVSIWADFYLDISIVMPEDYDDDDSVLFTKKKREVHLEWSEPTKPIDGVSSYDHVIATTPVGVIIVEWKSWKTSPSYDVEVQGTSIWIGAEDTLEEAKKAAQVYVQGKLEELLKLTTS